MTKLCINVQYGCLILFVMTIIHGLVIIVMFKFIVVHLLVFQDGDLMVLTFVYSIATEIYATYNKNIFLSFFFFFFLIINLELFSWTWLIVFLVSWPWAEIWQSYVTLRITELLVVVF